MDIEAIRQLIVLGGIGHIILSIGSLSIPRALQWNEHLKNLQPLLRQMFWTYAGYILVINFSFGIISIYGASELANKSFLAQSITAFISAYWLARVIIQFIYFDKTFAPKGIFFTLGEWGLVLMFVSFTLIYAIAFLFNISWM